MTAETAVNENLTTHPIVPLDQLIDQTPDGSLVIELYQSVRTVRDIEAVNEHVKAQVIKAQSIATDIARLQAATFKSCDDSDAPQIEAIANKVRGFSTTLVRVDSALAKSLVEMMQKVGVERPGSTRAKEDVNRYVLVAHELDLLRVQTQEIAKNVGSIAVSIRTAAASCTPTPVPPLFAEHGTLRAEAPEIRSPALPPQRANNLTTRVAPRSSW